MSRVWCGPRASDDALGRRDHSRSEIFEGLGGSVCGHAPVARSAERRLAGAMHREIDEVAECLRLNQIERKPANLCLDLRAAARATQSVTI